MAPIFRVISLFCFTLVGCAISRNQADFDVAPAGGGDVFISSRELLVSGLVSESLGVAGRGRLFDAESRLRRALELSPKDPAIRYNLALVLSQQGYGDEAFALLNNLRIEQGDHPRYALALADLHLGQQRLSEARTELKRAFSGYLKVQNFTQAATVARSISNLAFAEGLEQEALCYSYEALNLDTSAVQLGYHASIMVALNQFASAEKFIAEQLALNPALGAVPRVHLARALARAALGDLTGAVEESELAQNLLAQDAELGSEVNVAWWLFKKKLPETEEEINDAKLQESLEAIQPEVKRLSEKPTYGTLRWPRVVLGWLEESAKLGVS